MTKLSKQSEKSEHDYATITEISAIQVDGNTTHMTLEVPLIITKDGKVLEPTTVIAEIPTLELVQTFNTTWTNHAISKLKTWINQLSK